MGLNEKAGKVAQAIREDCGSWAVSELGDDGLRDAIWDTYRPYQKMTRTEQRDFFDAVYRELFG
jgi:hypothetical protein